MSGFDHEEPDYEVGYGRPPVETQFKKGQSGNPAGRKKKPSELERIKGLVEETVTVTIDGEQVQISAREALIRSCMAKALNGNIRQARQFVGLLKDLGIEVVSKNELEKLDAAHSRAASDAMRRLREEIFAVDEHYELMDPYRKRHEKLVLSDPDTINRQIEYWLGFLDDAKEKEDLEHRLAALKREHREKLMSKTLINKITRRHREGLRKPR